MPSIDELDTHRKALTLNLELGSENGSCRQHILVENAAESITSLDTTLERSGRRGARCSRGLWRPQIQAAMRTMPVVVIHEGRDGAFEVLLVQNQESIDALGPNRAHKALRHRICLGRSVRSARFRSLPFETHGGW